MTDMKRPPLSLEIGEYTIKMTYGLQMDLQKLLPDPEQVISLLTADAYLRDIVVRRALTPAEKPVKDDEDLISANEIDLDPDQIVEVLDFVAGHLVYFFGNTASSAARLGGQYQEKLAQLLHSMNGSQTSPSTTPSAGLSDVSKETSTISTSD